MADASWLFRVEGSRRSLSGIPALAFNLVAIGFSGFYLYTSGFGLVSTQTNRGIYLMLTSVLVFLLYPARAGSPKTRPSVVDLVFVAAAVASVTQGGLVRGAGPGTTTVEAVAGSARASASVSSSLSMACVRWNHASASWSRPAASRVSA